MKTVYKLSVAETPIFTKADAPNWRSVEGLYETGEAAVKAVSDFLAESFRQTFFHDSTPVVLRGPGHDYEIYPPKWHPPNYVIDVVVVKG